jgi:hypothetical protein
VIAGDIASAGSGMHVDRDEAAKSYIRVCDAEGGLGCPGLNDLCERGVLHACERLEGAMQVDEPTPGTVFIQVAALRRKGNDRGAVKALQRVVRSDKSPQLLAELALAYQGSGEYVSAERLLKKALEETEDPWITKHRVGLQRALGHTKMRLGDIVLECAIDGQEGHVAGAELACDRPFRIEIGEHTVEVRAPNHRSVRITTTVQPAKRAVVSSALESHTCENRGMIQMAGADGGCCWPGQSWAANSCSGVATGSVAMYASSSQPSTGLASVHFRLLGGVTNFVGSSLFRNNVNANSDSTDLGPRGEIRAGIHLGSFLTFEAIVGGARQGFTHWDGCGAAGDCVSDFPFSRTVDFGAMLAAHTNPLREGGNLDFHIGVGVRPWTRIGLEDADSNNVRLTSTVVPGELGASLFFGKTVSFDLLGQAELWLPWKYCDSECVGTDRIDTEFGWSALGGLTVHVD